MSHIANTLWEENLEEMKNTSSKEDVYKQNLSDVNRAVKAAKVQQEMLEFIDQLIRK